MSLRRTVLTVVLASSMLLSGCALRPRYKELVEPAGSTTAATAGQTMVFRVVDAATNKPVQGAKVRAGERRVRLNTVSDADGLVQVQVAPELLDENPLVEVVLPKGVQDYRLKVVPSGVAPAQPAAPADAPAAPPAATEPTPAAPATPATPATPEATK